MFFTHFGFGDILGTILLLLIGYSYFRMWRRARKAEKLAAAYAGRIALLETMHIDLAKDLKGVGQALKG